MANLHLMAAPRLISEISQARRTTRQTVRATESGLASSSFVAALAHPHGRSGYPREPEMSTRNRRPRGCKADPRMAGQPTAPWVQRVGRTAIGSRRVHRPSTRGAAYWPQPTQSRRWKTGDGNRTSSISPIKQLEGPGPRSTSQELPEPRTARPIVRPKNQLHQSSPPVNRAAHFSAVLGKTGGPSYTDWLR